uniref:Uncharacterized protein n=1 Tax=Triticum urartu TaxID=4572 RepID=A0A8R7QWG4_TRIUA
MMMNSMCTCKHDLSTKEIQSTPFAKRRVTPKQGQAHRCAEAYVYFLLGAGPRMAFDRWHVRTTPREAARCVKLPALRIGERPSSDATG